MLTPVDIQQQKFKMGIGYDRKDVNIFFDEVSKSYEELYRSNAELKERVITLTDGLQHYKATEQSLQKSLMLAEKNSQEQKTNAIREAKNIELEAKNRANEIVKEAHIELEEIEEKIKLLETQYAEYKSNFASLVKQQFEILEVKDFDPDAFIDPDYASMAPKQGGSGYSSNDDSSSFGYTDDPQLRDSGSGLTGKSASQAREENRSSTTSVYGSKLGGNGIDPFGENKQNTQSSNSFKNSQPKKTSSLKMANEKNDEHSFRSRTNFETKSNVSNSTINEKSNNSMKASVNEPVKEPVKEPVVDSKKETLQTKVQEDANNQAEETISGDIQEKASNNIMIGNKPETSNDTDDDGFEFI